MYVLDHERQISLIREMTQLRRDSESWEVYYHHPSTNAMWKSYFPKATNESKGPKILRTEPVPDSLKERFENCLVEAEPENAAGLGIELSTTPEVWDASLKILETNYRMYHRKQLRLFLQHLGIEEYTSTLREAGLEVEVVSLTEEELDKLARRSKIIRYKRFWRFN